MRYKPGDRVKVKSQDWYKSNMNSICEVACGVTWFVPDMVVHCGNNVTIREVYGNYYRIIEDDGDYCWTDNMFEGLADDENVSESIDNTADLLPKYVKTTRDMNTEQTELDITEEYEYVDDMGNVIDTKKIIIRKKKPKYPTTYEECCKLLSLTPCYNVSYDYYRGKELNALYHLLVCRDAYWKIAGEEMGLGKPWEPNYRNVYIIGIEPCGSIIKYFFGTPLFRYVLVFPTAEMRDAFYENFKDLIESCKELLSYG